MSIDTVIRLPPNVRARDVANVIGKLLGLESRMEPLRGSPNAKAVYLSGTHVRQAGGSATMAFLFIEIPGGDDRSIPYCFEGRGGSRTVMLRSSPANIALARGLVDFFGGEADFADNDSSRCDYSKPARGDDENCPEDGPEWNGLQRRIHDLLAIRA